MRFSSHPENIATESLHYILNRPSSRAKQAFIKYLQQTGVILPNDLIFQTQKGIEEDQAIPDLIGNDANGHSVVIVEAKFWAGLTAHQPITYLKQLPEHNDGILLFVAPAKRFRTLWRDLLSRCKDGLNDNIDLLDTTRTEEFWTVRINNHHVLALVSWRSLLSYVDNALKIAGETEAVSDVLQLHGLCARMDSNAFLPLRSEELTADIGRRIVQYNQLVSDLQAQARQEGYEPGSLQGGYGRTFSLKFHGHTVSFGFNPFCWEKLHSTPLWLHIGKENEIPVSIRKALEILERNTPPRLLREEPQKENTNIFIPLELLIGSEKEGVIQHILIQLREIYRARDEMKL